MLFMEFFTGKGGPKITISFFQQGDDMGPELCGKSIIGAFAAADGKSGPQRLQFGNGVPGVICRTETPVRAAACSWVIFLQTVS